MGRGAKILARSIERILLEPTGDVIHDNELRFLPRRSKRMLVRDISMRFHA